MHKNSFQLNMREVSSLLKFFSIFIVILWLYILIFNKRILVYEHKVEPGDNYVVKEYGNLGEDKQSSLVCKYFNGRSFLTKVYWYSPNNFMGKDSCSFIGEKDFIESLLEGV